MFEPRSVQGPSGLADLPRPFVFRAGEVAGKAFQPGEHFEIDIHVFDLKHPAFAIFCTAMAQLEFEGLGESRSRVRLASVHSLDAGGQPAGVLFAERQVVTKSLTPIELLLVPNSHCCDRLAVTFHTPTEIKEAGSSGFPTFRALAGRARDRIANLRAQFGDGLLDLDFREFGERAKLVRTIANNCVQLDAERRSSRTGKCHPLGGFVGTITYEGELGPFLPWLQAAYWTGVGRQTVWGKGVVRSTCLG